MLPSIVREGEGSPRKNRSKRCSAVLGRDPDAGIAHRDAERCPALCADGDNPPPPFSVNWIAFVDEAADSGWRISGESPRARRGFCRSSSARNSSLAVGRAIARVRDDVGDQRVERERFFGNLIARVPLWPAPGHAADHFGESRRFGSTIASRFSARTSGIAVAPAPDELRVGARSPPRVLNSCEASEMNCRSRAKRILQAVEHRVERGGEAADFIAAFPAQTAGRVFPTRFLPSRSEPHDRID